MPIFDLAAFEAADPEERRRRAKALRRICEDKGFHYLVGHGLPPPLLSEVLAQARRFFDLPEADKRRLDKAKSRCNRGYEPLGGQVLEAGAPPDLKEGFYIGEHIEAEDPRAAAGLFNHGPNVWPEGLVGWREVMERYFLSMTSLCGRMMRALASSLDLEEDFFEPFCQEPMATLRLLRYPAQPLNPSPGEKGCGAHTDFGALTLLLQDDAGGLEVFDPKEGWVPVPPLRDALVVNLGDLVARWTNDRYRSTLHRVINTSGKERLSAPFFFTGRADHPITCLEPCREEGVEPNYPPTTAIGHLEHMYRMTYGPAPP